jgi:assimilatory nitrate reductase electron transfer subunit
MGETRGDDDDPSTEVLQFSDRGRGTYKKLVLRGGRLVGAILVGDLATVGTVTQLFERGAPAPDDRLPLLFAPRRGRGTAPEPAATPAAMPSATTVCRCNGVTKGRIQDSVLGGARTVQAVADATRATTGCGGCREVVTGIVDWLAAADPDPVRSALR